MSTNAKPDRKPLFRAHLVFLREQFPEFRRLVDSTIEDLDELDLFTEADGNVYRRIFLAVNEGCHRPVEISKKTGIDVADLKPLLAKMVDAGTLRTEEQGGKTEEARGARKILYFRAEEA